jgi:hypothetical protein
MNTAQKLEVLRDVSENAEQFDRVLDKLLEAALSQHRLQLGRYDHDLAVFEQKFGLDSATFYQQFEAGDLGDSMDFLNGQACMNCGKQ